MIVRIQKGGSARGTVILMCNEDRSFIYETDNPDEVEPIIAQMEGLNRAYFKARFINNKIQIQKRIENPPW
jgi:hypothetical protein